LVSRLGCYSLDTRPEGGGRLSLGESYQDLILAALCCSRFVSVYRHHRLHYYQCFLLLGTYLLLIVNTNFSNTQSLGLDVDRRLDALADWFSSPVEVTDSPLVETGLEVSDTEPFYADTPKFEQPVGQQPRTPDPLSPEHFRDALAKDSKETTALGHQQKPIRGLEFRQDRYRHQRHQLPLAT
jgi:hypothetical protein